ncbi:MAG: aminotransferase class V-fold PLP-dependent enzyme [Deltaproteobacteria bacterium]|nr:aminotransferase class V-fold PLP-dependent enzyme [Deltaproteobacteria bacterium]
MIDFKHPAGSHVITSAVEHPAILNPLLYLMELGLRVTILPVDSMGRVDPEDVRRALEPDTVLVSIMLANNETGTIQPIEEISQITQDHGVLLHTDAAQAVGKMNVDVRQLRVDLMSVAGHKLYAPKGVGALYVREGVSLTPLIHGAGQEMNKRAGTENVMFAKGLGTACRVVKERCPRDV